MIYLDNSATTVLSDNVKQDIITNLENFGNPSSLYEIGLKTKRRIEEVREIVAKCIGGEKKYVYFTSGASESNTWIMSQFDKVYLPNPIEHHSILNNPKVTNKYEPNCLVSQMYVNNEIGLISDIQSLKKKYPNSYIHSDCTQALGNIDINVQNMNVDSISFSGHKIHAPKGIGVLYSTIPMKPLIYGGKQEYGVRGGTENFIGISALGIAIQESTNNIKLKQAHCYELKNRMIDNLKHKKIDFIVNAENMNTVPNILSLSFKNVSGEAMLILLDSKEIYCSSGSACSSGELEPSETLKWLNIPKEYIDGTLRFSFDLCNTTSEIDIVCNEIERIIGLLSK